MSGTPPIEQQNMSAGRVVRLRVGPGAPRLERPVDADSALPGATGGPPVPVATEPDITTSPMRADGQTVATGVMFMLQPVKALPGGDFVVPPPIYAAAAPLDPALGFHVVIWVRNPVTGHWGATSPIDVRFAEWYRTFDFNGGDLFFQITGDDGAVGGAPGGAPGTYLDLHVVEL